MLNAYVVQDNRLQSTELEPGDKRGDIVWVDLFNPSRDEDRLVEELVGVEIPTRAEAEEIEPSSRLYVENGARYMTAGVVYGADRLPHPLLTIVTFILTDKTLVTVRYEDLTPFRSFISRMVKSCGGAQTAEMVFTALLGAQIDRNADVLERVAEELDGVSSTVFAKYGTNSRQRRYHDVICILGLKGELLSKTRDSLLTLGRVVHFYAADRAHMPLTEEVKGDLHAMTDDVTSLTDHSNFMINKVNFLLDSVVGLVSIEQNEIIKLFSVVAFVFLPPTLVASIYGMNFETMPELHWKLGYPFALLLMVVSAVVPYWIFKWRKWL